MPLSKTAQKYLREIQAMAAGLPFKQIALSDFKRTGYQPNMVRQQRTYTHATSDAQAIGRFLAERGIVELLSPEATQNLFKEIHWCGYQIRAATRKRFRSARHCRDAVVRARGLVSRIEAAEEELFIANRRLVVSCVKPFFWMGQVWVADFLQEGSKALSNAVRKFDFTRGTPFYAYAQKAVQNRLRNFFRDHVRSGSIGICPTRDMTTIKGIIDTWKADHGTDPDNAVIAKLTGFPENRVQKIRGFIHQWETMPAPPVSLDAMLGETTANLHELIEDVGAEEASDAAERSEVWAAIDRLPPRARYIMRLRFIEGRTLEETGQLLGLTRARIKQIQDDSLRKLRQMLRRGIANPRM
jgi:RNA polymerase primary sigma factor